MKYDLASDLHVDFDINDIDWASKKTHDSDIIIIAGDVSNTVEQTVDELRRISDHYKHVIFVDGNHEHYGNQLGQKTINDTENELLDKLSKYQNIAYLHRNHPSIVIGNVAFIGCNSWYDFKFIPDINTVSQCISLYMSNSSDPKQCNFTTHPEKMAIEHAEIIANEVSHFNQNKDIDKIVIITHTSPHYLGVTWKTDRHSWNLFNGAYGNSEMEKVWIADEHNKIVHAVYGHVHDQHDFYGDNGIRFITNPRGYVGYEASAALWTMKQYNTDEMRTVFKSVFGEIDE